MCIKDRISSHSSYNLLFSEKIQLHFVLVLWRVIGHPYIESATALSDYQPIVDARAIAHTPTTRMLSFLKYGVSNPRKAIMSTVPTAVFQNLATGKRKAEVIGANWLVRLLILIM